MWKSALPITGVCSAEAVWIVYFLKNCSVYMHRECFANSRCSVSVKQENAYLLWSKFDLKGLISTLVIQICYIKEYFVFPPFGCHENGDLSKYSVLAPLMMETENVRGSQLLFSKQ